MKLILIMNALLIIIAIVVYSKQYQPKLCEHNELNMECGNVNEFLKGFYGNR